MLSAAVKKEIINARALVITGPKGVPGKQLLSFAGSIPADDLKEMEKAIEDSCERINS